MSHRRRRGLQIIDHRVDLDVSTVYLRVCVTRDMHVGSEGGGDERAWS
jgi:hypothetical protein